MEDNVTVRSRFESLSRGAYLDVLLPKASDFDAAALIRDGSPEELARAPSRRNLFFDEEAKVVVILRCSSDAEDVKLALPQLELTIAAHATDAVPQGSGNAASASGKHDLSAATLTAGDDVDTVPAGDQTYVVWKSTLHLSRPRVRLQRPAIYFTASLSISSKTLVSSSKPKKDYLAPFEPLPRNVLEGLNSAPEFKGKELYLPEDIITKVAPKPPRKDDVARPIRGATKRAFPTMLALFTRVKFTALPDATIASLHLETSQVMAGTVNVEAVDFIVPHDAGDGDEAVAQDSVTRGVAHTPRKPRNQVQCLTDILLPLVMSTGDETVLLYQLPQKQASTSRPATSISITIHATADLDQGAQIELKMGWQSAIDAKLPATDSKYRWSRPSSISSAQRVPSPSASAPVATPSHNDHTAELTDGGVTFLFTATATTTLHADWLLAVQCINRSLRQRNFAIVPLRPKQSPLAARQHDGSDNADLVAGVFNAPVLDRSKSPDTFCFTPEVRTGPILPGASSDSVLEIRAIKTGVLDLGTIRIIDLDTEQSIDVTDLPDTVAFEALEGTNPDAPSKFAPKLPEAQKGYIYDMHGLQSERSAELIQNPTREQANVAHPT